MINIDTKTYTATIDRYSKELRQVDNYNLHSLFKAYFNMVKKIYRTVRASEINGSIVRVSHTIENRIENTMNIRLKKIYELIKNTVFELKSADNKDWIYITLGVQNIMNDALADITECYNSLASELCRDNHRIQSMVPFCIPVKDNYDTSYIPEGLTRIYKAIKGGG